MASALRFVNCRLIIGDGSEPIANATVVVNDLGVITYAGASAFAPPASGERIVDVRDRPLMPGFFDCHVHFHIDGWVMGAPPDEYPSVRVFNTMERMRLTLAAGITSARDLGGTDAGFRVAQERGLIDGPRLQVAVRLLSHTGGHLDQTNKSGFDLATFTGEGHEICDTVDEVRIATRRVLRDGADVVKICATGGVSSPSDQPEDEGLTEEEIRAVVEEVSRHRGRPVAAHAQGTAGILNAIRGGVTSIEHGYLIDDRAIDLALEHGTFLVPTLSTFGNLERGVAMPDHVYEKKRRLAGEADKRIAEAIARGVKIAVGTDAPVSRHGHNLEELGRLVALGMSPMQAIVAATSVSSELCGVGDRLGTVEVGKLADLVVCEGDPLADISVLEHAENIKLVVQSGRIVKDNLPVRPLGRGAVSEKRRHVGAMTHVLDS